MSKRFRLVVLVVLLIGVWAATRKSNVSEGAPPRETPTSSAPREDAAGQGEAAGQPGSAKPSTVDKDYPGLAQVPAGEEREAVVATLLRIERGGPFPYPNNDGVVFENRERRLPPKPRGFYREYTVPTPGSRDRGARRVVAGAQARYYSRNHYKSFETLTP